VLGVPYHVAFVVPELERAMARYGQAFDHRWTRIRDRTRTITTAAGPQDVRLRLVFSVQGPPYVELIERAPGSLWDGPETMHHIGYWADDVRAESDRLAAAGLPWAASMDLDEPGGRWRMAYHRSAVGDGYIELVDATVRPELEARLAGGAV
jgi:Glyoxalase/Bleomycin resistance protein/Dioxygenase superfamily